MTTTEAAPKRSRRKSAPSAPKGRSVHLGEVLTPLVEAESAATGYTVDEVVRRRLDRDYRQNNRKLGDGTRGRQSAKPLPSPESFAVVPAPPADATIANVVKAAAGIVDPPATADA